MNSSKENDPGQLNIDWPVDANWTAHRRRNIMESLDRLLTIRSVGLLAGAVRVHGSSDTSTEEERKAEAAGTASRKDRRNLQGMAVTAAMGQALDNIPIDRLVRMDLTEDKSRVNICLTFPVPPQAAKIYITGRRVIDQDPKNKPLWAQAINKMIDGVFNLIAGRNIGTEAIEDADQKIRAETDDETEMLLRQHWSHVMAKQLTIDLTLWARAEGIPGDGHMSWDEPHPEKGMASHPKPELGTIYQSIDGLLSDTDTNMTLTAGNPIETKADLIGRIIRSFGREPQPMWTRVEPVLGDGEESNPAGVRRAPKM